MKKLLFLLSLLLLALPSAAQDFICYPGVVRETATGKTYKTGSGPALKLAILLSDPAGSVIECNGIMKGVSVAIGDNGKAANVVRAEPIRVVLQPGLDHVSVGPIAIGGVKLDGGSPGHAVEHFEMVNLTVDGRFAQRIISGYYKTTYGDLIFDGIEILSGPNTQFGGRIHGHARSVIIVGTKALGGGQEHPWYVDNPTGPGSFIYYGHNIAQGWGRTAGQFVTRQFPNKDNYVNPGAAEGDLVIEYNQARGCGFAGAHNYTVTGWPNGTVFFRNNYAESPHDTGLFICYADGKQGNMLTPEGFSVDRLVWLDNGGVYANAGRDMNGIGGVREVIVRGGNLSRLSLRGNKSAFNFDWNGVANGSLVLESRGKVLETWNLQTGAPPFRRNRIPLSDNEVEALTVLPAQQAPVVVDPGG